MGTNFLEGSIVIGQGVIQALNYKRVDSNGIHGRKFLGGETLEQGCLERCLWKHSRPGWMCSGQPDLVADVPAGCRKVGLDDL